MAFDRGYISPYFVTNTERWKRWSTTPTSSSPTRRSRAVNDILPLLERLLQVSKNLVIIADDIDGEALATLAVNKLRGTINIVAVKAPGFGDRRKDNLGDLAASPAPRSICEEIGRKLDRVEDRGPRPRPPGHRLPRKKTTIIEGKGTKKDVEPASRRSRDARRRPRATGTARSPGAPRQARRQRRRHQGRRRHRSRAQGEEAPRRGRALGATRAAVEEGIVPGGGVALINALAGARQAQARRRRADRRRTSSAARSKSRCAASPSTPARTARSSSSR